MFTAISFIYSWSFLKQSNLRTKPILLSYWCLSHWLLPHHSDWLFSCLALFRLTHIKQNDSCTQFQTRLNTHTRTHTHTHTQTHTFCPIFKHHAGIVIQCSKKLDPYTLLPQGVVTQVIFECVMRLSTTRPQDTQDKTFMGPGLLQTYTHKHTQKSLLAHSYSAALLLYPILKLHEPCLFLLRCEHLQRRNGVLREDSCRRLLSSVLYSYFYDFNI